MSYPELETEPDAVASMFYECAIDIVQREGLISAESTKITNDLQRSHISRAEFDQQQEAYQSERAGLIDEKRSITNLLPEELRPGAHLFFTILPAIREAVASTRGGEPRPVTDFLGAPPAPSEYFYKAMLLGSRCTGYALTAHVKGGGMVFTTPGMFYEDIQVIDTAPKE